MRSALLLAALPTCMLLSCESETAPTSAQVRVGGAAFECRLALDEDARELGLGGVASLRPDEGLLFVFTDSAPRSFWMRGCVMDIDIAFIDPIGFVTAVHTMPAEPLQQTGELENDYYARLKRYPSYAPAQYALEVAAGRLAELGVARGTRVEFDRDLLKKHAR